MRARGVRVSGLEMVLAGYAGRWTWQAGKERRHQHATMETT